MAQYTWDDFYDEFYDWSESTQISRMSGLTDFGPSSEVFDVATEYADPKIATRFLKKAVKAGVKFTGDEIVNMIDNVTEEFIPMSIMRGGFDFQSRRVYVFFRCVLNFSAICNAILIVQYR